jgi:hypothetical protein
MPSLKKIIQKPLRPLYDRILTVGEAHKMIKPPSGYSVRSEAISNGKAKSVCLPSFK